MPQRIGGAMVLLLSLLVLFETATAATYSITWDFGINASLLEGKNIKAGDHIVFKYNPAKHNLVPVSSGEYNSCSVPAGAQVLRTGNDLVKLKKGQNYFLCSIPGHCKAGLKLAIQAA